jgi:hypothetical protein
LLIGAAGGSPRHYGQRVLVQHHARQPAVIDRGLMAFVECSLMHKPPVEHRSSLTPAERHRSGPTSYEALATRSFDRLLRQHRLEIRTIKWRFALAAVAIAILAPMVTILLTTGGQ